MFFEKILKAKVILDTNFLMIPGQFMVNIFAEIERIVTVPYQLCIIDKTIDELNKLIVLGKKKERDAAKLGLALASAHLKQKSLKIIASSSMYVDDVIVKESNKKVFVATNDKELKRRVREKGASIITLKQKKYLILE